MLQKICYSTSLPRVVALNSNKNAMIEIEISIKNLCIRQSMGVSLIERGLEKVTHVVAAIG